MDWRAGFVLGKRGRKTPMPEAVDIEGRTLPKRSRTWGEGEGMGGIEGGLLAPEEHADTAEKEDAQHAQFTIPDNGNGEEELTTQYFPFMRLPAELRIHVYHMALSRAEPLLLQADRPADKSDEDVTIINNNSTESPTTLTAGFSTTINRTDRRVRDRSVGPQRVRLADPIIPKILRLNKLIYREARQVLYSDNVFTLSLTSGIYTLSTLHQRSRSLIKSVILTIPSHHDILDGFADLVRLGLRYCWGLKSFKIILQASLPDDGGRVSGATSVYANAFHILRWLPRSCTVELEGCVSESVMTVVREEGRLQGVLDEVSFLSFFSSAFAFFAARPLSFGSLPLSRREGGESEALILKGDEKLTNSDCDRQAI